MGLSTNERDERGEPHLLSSPHCGKERTIEVLEREYNNKRGKALRRKLRCDSTKAEGILWGQLRNRRIANLKFRRQYSINNYIVDFYCPELKLVIEVDGDSHCSEFARRYDAKREREIASLGIKILRVTNTDVYENLSGVVATIIALSSP